MMERSLLPEKHCGDAGLAQRCQLHKRHNALRHFFDEHQTQWGNSTLIRAALRR
jgi:hypothetical protein